MTTLKEVPYELREAALREAHEKRKVIVLTLWLHDDITEDVSCNILDFQGSILRTMDADNIIRLIDIDGMDLLGLQVEI